MGSSPHTRGALNCKSVCDLAAQDHPRIRGEHLHQSVSDSGLHGIIPAYAGSTTSPLR